MSRSFREITSRDVGSPFIQAFGRGWTVTDFIGRILPGDVGKRIYLVGDNSGNGFLQVENDQQLAKRKESEND